MNLDDRQDSGVRSGLLLDTNLLVLYAIGTVSTDRIKTFKRTSIYSREDYELLVQVINRFSILYTVAHVMAEVSNLTDLKGPDRLRARRVLADTIAVLKEPHVSSLEASGTSNYENLGLTDAAISVVAHEYKCEVLTDDLDLYLSLLKEGVTVEKFSHLRERNWRR
jgi:hypothetical protein